MKHFFKNRILGCLSTLLLLGAGRAQAAPFTPGNVVVVRVGDGGTAALSGSATAVFLLEYTPAGTLVQTIALPTAVSGANRALTASGTATSELNLTRSADGRYLVLTGYDAAPGTASITATAAAATNRVIGRVAADGTVDTSTRLSDAFDAAGIRAAASANGQSFYAVGANSGVRYVPFGSSGASTALTTAAPTNNRYVNVFRGSLFVSSASGSNFGVSQVGTGLPTMAGQTITQLPGFPTATGPSPYAFYFADLSAAVPGLDVVYVADDRTTAEGGIQKWSLVGTTWTLNGTITAATAPVLRGLSGSTVSGVVSLVASGNTGVYVVADAAGYNAAPTTAVLAAPIATAATNAALRGVAFAPLATAIAATLPTQALPGLAVFPNPAADRLTVALPTAGAATVALRDLTGRAVLAPVALPADQQLRLPTTLAAGVYLLEVRQGGVTAVRRVEKQ